MNFTTRQDFIKLIAPACEDFQSQHNIVASLLIAQGCLESNFGTEMPANSNNLFGVKADASWTGPFVWADTAEYNKDTNMWVTVKAKFRQYPSIRDSVFDHDNFLIAGPRYTNLQGKDYKTACELIQSDGYATDPSYASSLISIIEEYNLTQYDKGVHPVYESMQVKVNGHPYQAYGVPMDGTVVTHVLWTCLHEYGVPFSYHGNGVFTINDKPVTGVVVDGNSYVPWTAIAPGIEATKEGDTWEFEVPKKADSQPVIEKVEVIHHDGTNEIISDVKEEEVTYSDGSTKIVE